MTVDEPHAALDRPRPRTAELPPCTGVADPHSVVDLVMNLDASQINREELITRIQAFAPETAAHYGYLAWRYSNTQRRIDPEQSPTTPQRVLTDIANISHPWVYYTIIVYHLPMAMNIKDPVTEEMATELASRLGITKTAAIRHALQAQLALTESRSHSRLDATMRVLETEIWPLTTISGHITKADREEILGYNSDGVSE